MNKKVLAWLCMPLCILALVFAGCVPSNPPAPGASETDKAQDAKIATMQNLIEGLEASKANDSTVSQLSQRVTTLEGQPSADTYKKSELYTRAQVDEEIQRAIDDLKSDQDWITGDSSSNGSSDPSGQLVDSDGDLELWVERVSPASDQFRTDEGQNNDCIWFDFIVVNNSNSSCYFDLELSITPDEDCRLFATTTGVSSPDLDWEVDGTFVDAPDNAGDCATAGGDWDGTVCNHAGGIELDDGDELDFQLDDREWIGANSSQGYYAEISIYQDEPFGSGDDVWWTYDWRIRER